MNDEYELNSLMIEFLDCEFLSVEYFKKREEISRKLDKLEKIKEKVCVIILDEMIGMGVEDLVYKAVDLSGIEIIREYVKEKE